MEVWGLRRCSNLQCTSITKSGAVCRKIYNRDYNSCLNMHKIVQYLKTYGKRPHEYCRPIH